MKKFAVLFLIFTVIFSAAADMLALGSPASEIEVKTWVHQNPVTLAQFKDKKPVVLFFWALDNASIMAFRPLADLTKQIKGDKVAWIGIASGEESNIAKFKLTKVLPFPVALDNGNTVKKYLPANVKYPACVIISADGRLVWRGTVRGMPIVLKRLLSGKLDINEIARKEQFNISLGRAVKEKKFKDAVALIEREQKGKFSADLAALHVQLLLEMNETAAASKLLNDTIEAHPDTLGPHLLRLMLCRSFFKDEKKALDAAKDSAEKLKEHPAVLANLLQNEMKLSFDMRSPECIMLFADAVYAALAKLDKPREQANVLMIYAQAMNMCALNQRAEEAAAKAESLFADGKEKKTAEMLKNYYRKLNSLKNQQKNCK